ncbi:hypothetical protein PTTG_28373, partial [Puccinia triticina 1-1 BBBD Race 1]
ANNRNHKSATLKMTYKRPPSLDSTSPSADFINSELDSHSASTARPPLHLNLKNSTNIPVLNLSIRLRLFPSFFLYTLSLFSLIIQSNRHRHHLESSSSTQPLILVRSDL